MTNPAPRTVRLRRLASEVRRLRKRANLSQADAATLIGINRTTLVAIENAKNLPHRSNMLSILQALGASPSEREALLTLLVNPADPAWMRPLRGALPDAYGLYIDLESGAASIQWYEPLLIPGLLQTESYAAAHARGCLPASTDEQIQARVTARMRRQAAFTERAAPLSVVITEAALRYQVGAPDVLGEQLQRLVSTGDTPDTITIQVIPFTAGAHPSMMASFGILTFSDTDPPVVYQESPGGDLFFEEPEDIAAHLPTPGKSRAGPGRNPRTDHHSTRKIVKGGQPTMAPELRWRKSTTSGENGACIQIADLPDGGLAIRDSKHPHGPRLHFDRAIWLGFLTNTQQEAFNT